MVGAYPITGSTVNCRDGPGTSYKVVKSYKLKHEKGIGLVFVVDRLVKLQETGCIYVVFFDVSSRKVLKCERVSEKAFGFGFRNYWFRPVKEAVRKLPAMYSAVKAETSTTGSQ